MKIAYYIKKFLEITLTLGVLVLIVSVYLNKKTTPINKIELVMPQEDQPIISKVQIYQYLRIDSLLGIRNNAVLLFELNKLVLEQDFISESKLYFSIEGDLNIDIKLAKPIARVIVDKGSYYVDDRGNTIRHKLSHAPAVLLVRGKGAQRTEYWLKVVRHITLKEDLKKTVSELFVNKQGDISMRTRLAKFSVIFGHQDQIHRKFRKLRIIVSKLSKDKIMDKYKSINLIYPGQVVCKV